MPKTHVNKKVIVNASAEQIYAILADFSHWAAWSPWSIMEPEVNITISENNSYYEWVGGRTGSGNMRIVGQVENKSVSIDLNFLKPWKSYAKVEFHLKPSGEGTEVTWTMDSSLPFFMFWMKKMMEIFIGMDFDRGLRLLKDYAEDGEAHCKLTFGGRESHAGFQFVGMRTECTMETMGKKMEEDMPKLAQLAQENGLQITGPAFTQYHKWDVKNSRVVYTSGIPVAEVPANLPAGFFKGSIPATTVQTITMQGPYHHLGNAWSTLYSMQRNKEFKLNKAVHPFEEYHNSPHDTAQNDLLTKVCFPIV